MRLDHITYTHQHFKADSQDAARALPVNVMGVRNDAGIPTTLGELQAHAAAAGAVPAVAGTYIWPLRGLLPRGTAVRVAP